METMIATTDDEIAACYTVMKGLRPHIRAEDFVVRVRLQERFGYRLAFSVTAERPVAVAGFRVVENLAWGRFLYVDDLVTLPGARSRGFGAALLAWIEALAAREGCAQLHLDSGVQRKDAHRFYEREGMPVMCFHFAKNVAPGGRA